MFESSTILELRQLIEIVESYQKKIKVVASAIGIIIYLKKEETTFSVHLCSSNLSHRIQKCHFEKSPLKFKFLFQRLYPSQFCSVRLKIVRK